MADSEPFLFISHVSEDRMAAMDIVSELERRGIPCWIAPRNIAPGHPFDDEIASALERCRAMLLVFSDQCNESEYIRREVTVAGENQKIVIPLRIEDAQPRRGLRIRLSDLHWLDAFRARDQAFEELTKRFAPSWVETEPHGTEERSAQSAPIIARPKEPPSIADVAEPAAPPAATAT